MLSAAIPLPREAIGAAKIDQQAGQGAAGRCFAEISEDVPGIDRGQLIAVSQEDQAGAGRHGEEELRHGGEIDHRGLVHDHQIQGEGTFFVITGSRRIGTRPEQPMQRDGLELLQLLRSGNGVKRAPQGFGEPRRRLARGSGHRHAEDCPSPEGLLMRDGEERGRGARLAGARAAGDDAQASAERCLHGLELIRGILAECG